MKREADRDHIEKKRKEKKRKEKKRKGNSEGFGVSLVLLLTVNLGIGYLTSLNLISKGNKIIIPIQQNYSED